MLINEIKAEMRRLGIPGISKVNSKNKEIFIEIIKKEHRKQKRAQKPSIKKKLLRVQKIVYEKDYWITCDNCGRELKKCVITNQGNLGWRCYLSAIGVPPPERFHGNIKKLPIEAFESLAPTVIKRIMKSPRKNLILAVTRMGEDEMKRYLVDIPKFHSYNLISYKIKLSSGEIKKDYGFISSNIYAVPDIGFDSSILRKVLATNTFKHWFGLNQKINAINKEGQTYRKDLMIPASIKNELLSFLK